MSSEELVLYASKLQSAYAGRQPSPCGLALALRIHLASPQGLCAWAKPAKASSRDP